VKPITFSISGQSRKKLLTRSMLIAPLPYVIPNKLRYNYCCRNRNRQYS